MSERDLEKLWRTRIGPPAAREMRSWRRLSLILGLCFVGIAGFALWMSLPSSGSLPAPVALTGCAIWLALTIVLTVRWATSRKTLRVLASGEVSRRFSRVLLVPFGALSSIDRFDDWIAAQEQLPPEAGQIEHDTDSRGR
jgi:hypothetical protein